MATRNHFRKFQFLCLLTLASLVPLTGEAQNNAGNGAASSKSTVEKSPLTDLWMGYSSQGNIQLAESIAALSRLKQWPQVNNLLARVAGSGANEEVLTAMAQQIGSRNILAIQSAPSMTKAGKSGLEMLIKALRSTTESPERLRQAIAELDSKTSDKSLAATRVLLSGGEASIIELVAAAIKKPTPDNRDQLLRTMLQLGSGGVQGLQQLALYGTDEVRAPALECLARIDRPSHAIDFLTAALAADSTPEERAVGELNLTLLGRKVPSPAAGQELLLSNFKKSELEAGLTKNDDARTTLWSVDDSRTGITHQTTQELLAVYRGVADAASRLRRVGGLKINDASEIMAAELGYRLMLDPDWGDPAQIQKAKEEFPILTDATSVLNALEHAIQTNDLPAAVGLLRVIDAAQATASEKQIYLRGTGINRTALVRAASSPEPRIRYEAALKVNDLAKGQAFPGSSFVMRTLSEMNSLTNKPSAILVETRADTTMQAESLLSSIGFQVEVVRSVAGLQRAIRRGGDLRMVLAKTQLSDLAPIEMVDNVRRLDRGKQVPIVFYGPSGPDLSSRRWQAPTLWIDQPASIATLENLRRKVKQSRRIPQMTFLDRQTYKTLAAQALAERS